MRARVCGCARARLCVYVYRVGRGLCAGGNPLFPRGRITWSCPGKLQYFHYFYLFTYLLCCWLDVCCSLNNRSSCRTSECKMFADPRKERERTRERGRRKRERQRGARYITPDTSVHAQISRTRKFPQICLFLFPRFASLFLHFPKRRIFIQKLFFGDKIVVMIDDWQTRVLTRLTGRCTFQQV